MWKRPSDDEGTYKYIQQFLGGQVLVFIFVVEFVIANPLFFILGMSLLLRHFEVPYISRVVWLIHNSTMTSGTKFALEVQNGSINSFYDFSDGWLLAAGAGNGVEGGSRNRVLSRVRKPLPGAFELLPPRGIGKHVGRDPAISVPPPQPSRPSTRKANTKWDQLPIKRVSLNICNLHTVYKTAFSTLLVDAIFSNWTQNPEKINCKVAAKRTWNLPIWLLQNVLSAFDDGTLGNEHWMRWTRNGETKMKTTLKILRHQEHDLVFST